MSEDNEPPPKLHRSLHDCDVSGPLRRTGHANLGLTSRNSPPSYRLLPVSQSFPAFKFVRDLVSEGVDEVIMHLEEEVISMSLLQTYTPGTDSSSRVT